MSDAPHEALALFGGTALRNTPFASKPMVDEKEIQAVTQSMRDGLFSRFVGSNVSGTRDHLEATSESLRDLAGSHTFFGGPNVRRFEADWAAYHQVPYAISMNSATSGLTAALMAMGVGPGDEVITPPLSFTATATAIICANAIPVFADIDPETLCLSAAAVEKKITPKTKAILPVHWCGNAGEFQKILDLAKSKNLYVLEDAAQAPGTLYQGKYLGAHGTAGVFSFSEPKNVTTGEGGMVITHDPKIAAKCRLIRNHGEAIPLMEDPEEFLAGIIGYNFRMVEATAAMGWVQTSKLNQANQIRHENYFYLIPKLQRLLGNALVPQRLTHADSFAAYTAVFRWDEKAFGFSRNILIQALRKEGIPVANGVGRLMSDHPLFLRKIAYGKAQCPFSCHLASGKIDYKQEDFPFAHQVHDREYIAFFLMGWPNTYKDMDDIVAAFEKIISQSDLLQKYHRENPEASVAFDLGRRS